MVKLKKNELARINVSSYERYYGQETLGDLVDKYGRDARIEAEIESGCWGDPDSSLFSVCVNRLETDDEYNRRIERLTRFYNEERIRKKEERTQRNLDEKAEYERLKKKFGE